MGFGETCGALRCIEKIARRKNKRNKRPHIVRLRWAEKRGHSVENRERSGLTEIRGKKLR